MNIYEKLAHARVDLQKTGLRKGGKNAFAKYDYFELGDFLPTINLLMVQYKMLGVVSFGTELVTLTIYDAEKPEDKIEFTCPRGSADLKGCHEVQNNGAVYTYDRRYLYVAAFEIVEGDVLDTVTGKPNKQTDDDPLGTGDVKHLPPRGEKCQGCGAVLTTAQVTLAKKYAKDYGGRLLCADCRAKEDLGE